MILTGISLFRRFILAAIFLTVGWSLGVSAYSNSTSVINQSPDLSANDSLVLDIIDILRYEKDLPTDKRLEFEKKIESFPGKILRRDTASYYLQTLFLTTFHEFVTENYQEAITAAEKFKDDIQEADFHDNISKFSSIKYVPTHLKSKEKLKNDSVIQHFDLLRTDVSDWNFQRSKQLLTSEIFEGLPMDLHIFTYKVLLNFYKDIGGYPKGLNEYLIGGFYHHAIMAGREDILKSVINLWGLKEEDFNNNNPSGFYKYAPQDLPDSSFLNLDPKLWRNIALAMFDDDGNIPVIDSLISIHQADSIGKYVNNFQNMKFQKGKNREVIEMSAKYEKFVPEPWKHLFYNYWGMAHIALGEHREALDQLSKAIEYRPNKDLFSGAVLNYALALAGSGRYQEAIECLQSQKDKAINNGEKLNYWEGLGYIYSLFNLENALECYNYVDKIIEESPYLSLNTDFSYLTRHFVREARLVNNDLFRWRDALRNARFYSGEDSPFDFYGTIYNGLYHSEMGRYRNLLFDFEGAAKDFRMAEKKFAELDSADYRIKFYNDSWQDLSRFQEPYIQNPASILPDIKEGNLSPLHKIWLLCNLINLKIKDNPDVIQEISFSEITDHLQEEIGGALMALSSDENKFLIVPLSTLQELLMSHEEFKDNPEESARLNLLRKGLIQTSKIALEKNLSNGSAPERYLELKDLRKRLNHAYIYEDSLRIKKLLPMISKKERDLYYSLIDSLDISQAMSIDLNSIRANLQDRDIAIDFIEYKENENILTGAFIYFPDGDIRYVELLNPNTDLNNPQNLWKPLLPIIENRENIYFSPDGSLINLGIEFFADQDGEPLLQNHRLHRVSHLRNISEKAGSMEGEIALIAVSDHNSPVGHADNIFRGNWKDLPDVEFEIKLIDSVLKDFPHQIFFNDDAIEENVKAIDGGNISVIHFSSHGIYRSLDSLVNASIDKDHFDHNIALRTLKTDRQEICGIVLRKGNLTWKMPHLLDDEDDILTAEEIENMNFPDLQLTVLSACDSGLGEISREGVQGLQRAFRIAGSKNIICSLNEVNDYWSALFMGELYKNLAAGMTIYDSFLNAQHSLREAAPDNPSAWSSYILIE